VCGEQALDPAFAALGLAAEAELAVDDRAPESALGMVSRPGFGVDGDLPLV